MNGAAGPLPIVVLISGAGSNLRGDRRAGASRRRCRCEIRAVISDRAGRAGPRVGRCRGPRQTAVVAAREFADRAAFDAALAAERRPPRARTGGARGLHARAGRRFRRTATPAGCSTSTRRCCREHRGLHTHRRALEAGDRVHGASVHFVTPELDGGPVVLQARVPVRDDDDEARLAARVLAQEHRIYPECIGWFAAGRLACRDGRRAARRSGTRGAAGAGGSR